MSKPKIKTKVKKEIPGLKIKNTKEKPIGKITHYFSNIEVGVIKLSNPLGQGDEIRIVGGENTDFNQKVDSMQIDHKEIKKAKKGDSVGLKVSEKVREGYGVYKI